MNRMSERETVVELPFAADCCPCVEKLRTVLPFTVGIRDGVVQLVSTLGSVVISARGSWVAVCAFPRLCVMGVCVRWGEQPPGAGASIDSMDLLPPQ
jgi:hypothetical protein